MDRSNLQCQPFDLERENAQLRDTVRALRDCLERASGDFAQRLSAAERRAGSEINHLRATISALRARLDGAEADGARRIAAVESRFLGHRHELETTIGELNRRLRAAGEQH